MVKACFENRAFEDVARTVKRNFSGLDSSESLRDFGQETGIGDDAPVMVHHDEAKALRRTFGVDSRSARD